MFFVEGLADIPCALMSKLQQPINAFASEGLCVEIPKYSRFLRMNALSSDPCDGGDSGGSEVFGGADVVEPSKKKLKSAPKGFPRLKFEVAFGLP